MYQIDYAHPFWLICLLGLAWLGLLALAEGYNVSRGRLAAIIY